MAFLFQDNSNWLIYNLLAILNLLLRLCSVDIVGETRIKSEENGSTYSLGKNKI